MWNENSFLINTHTHTQKKTSKSKNRYFHKFKKNSFSVFQNVCPRNMQVIFTVLKVVLQGPFFPQLESILVVKRLLSHPKAMAELEQSWQDMHICSKAQSCLALCQPMDCTPPGSSVHGISQARILECIAFPFPGDLPYPGIKPASLVSPALIGEFFTNFNTWEQDMKQKMEAPWFPFQSLFHETFSNKLHSKQNKNFSVGKQIHLITFFYEVSNSGRFFLLQRNSTYYKFKLYASLS